MYSKFQSEGYSTQDYTNFKEKVANYGVLRKIVSFREIQIINKNVLMYQNNVTFKMSDNAFNTLVKMLGFSNEQIKNLTNTLGSELSNDLIKLVQSKMANNKIDNKNQITMLVSRQTKDIVGFSKTTETILSNNAYFDLFEQTMNNHKNMQIKNLSISDEGNIEITVLNNNWEFNVGGLNDEFFKSGLVFINTPDKTIVNPYNERLVCTNGMVTPVKGASLVLTKNSAGDVAGFFDAVTSLKNVESFENVFKAKINIMRNTIASFAEVSGARKQAEYVTNNITDSEVRRTLEAFLPTKEIELAYMQRGYDLNTLKDKQLRKVKTNLKVWDLVNNLTDYASHPARYGVTFMNETNAVFNLQKYAGEIVFKDDYDFGSPVPDIF